MVSLRVVLIRNGLHWDAVRCFGFFVVRNLNCFRRFGNGVVGLLFARDNVGVGFVNVYCSHGEATILN